MRRHRPTPSQGHASITASVPSGRGSRSLEALQASSMLPRRRTKPSLNISSSVPLFVASAAFTHGPARGLDRQEAYAVGIAQEALRLILGRTKVGGGNLARRERTPRRLSWKQGRHIRPRGNIHSATASFTAVSLHFVMAGHHDLLAGHHVVLPRKHSERRGVIYGDASTRRDAATPFRRAGRCLLSVGRCLQRRGIRMDRRGVIYGGARFVHDAARLSTSEGQHGATSRRNSQRRAVLYGCEASVNTGGASFTTSRRREWRRRKQNCRPAITS